ncbi:MAG: LacI family DNA-binding transcriptional regulator, partial [bacterium]
MRRRARTIINNLHLTAYDPAQHAARPAPAHCAHSGGQNRFRIKSKIKKLLFDSHGRCTLAGASVAGDFAGGWAAVGVESFPAWIWFMATIHDVARMAAVAPSTVSLVANGKPHVKPATRQRVEA